MSSSPTPSPPLSRRSRPTATSARTPSPTRTTPGGRSAPGKIAAGCRRSWIASRTWASAGAWTTTATRRPLSTGSRTAPVCRTGRPAGATSPLMARSPSSRTHPPQIRTGTSPGRSSRLPASPEETEHAGGARGDGPGMHMRPTAARPRPARSPSVAWVAAGCSAKVGVGDPVGMPRWPLHQFDPVTVGVGEPGGLGAVRAGGEFGRGGPQARLGERCDRGNEILGLDHEVAESGTDVHGFPGRPVDQLQRDDLLAGKPEHGQAGAIADVNATDLAIPEREVELERGGQVGDAIRGMQGFHAADRTPGYRRKPGEASLVNVESPVPWYPARGSGHRLVTRVMHRRGEPRAREGLFGLVVPEPVLARLEALRDRV